MKDIVEVADGKDLQVTDWAPAKAANVIRTQLNSLEYAPTFGVDLNFFIESGFRFENTTFQSYLIQRLAEHQLDVVSVLEIIDSLMETLSISVRDSTVTGGVPS